MLEGNIFINSYIFLCVHEHNLEENSGMRWRCNFFSTKSM